MSNIKVTIQLDPEFGWSTTNTPIYGPGSVLKGAVRVQNASNQQSDRIRILFHASESLIAVPNADPYSVDYQNHREQFFGSQRTLWSKKSETALEDDTVFPFTIQLPMVQFPPSIEMANFYSCRFELVCYLEGASNELLAQDSCPVTYLPQIETRADKECTQPFCLEAQDKQQRKFKFQLSALDYIPGDTVHPKIYQPSPCRVNMELFQVFTIRTKGVIKKYRRSVAVGTQLLDLPDDLVPSYSYGRVVSVSYELRVSFLKPVDTGFTNLLSFKSSRAAATLPDIPIRIGTLGYGIKPSDELQVYTAFKSLFDKGNAPVGTAVLPAPKYVSSAEYKDALPLYEDYQLPAYQDL